MDLAERLLAEQLADGEEIPVPAAILEHDQRPAGHGGGRDQLLGLRDRGRERLVDDDRGSRGERREALLEVDVGGEASTTRSKRCSSISSGDSTISARG